jgi:hypothetical protein
VAARAPEVLLLLVALLLLLLLLVVAQQPLLLELPRMHSASAVVLLPPLRLLAA